MNSQQLIEYCLGKAGAVHDYQAEWQADRVSVGGKMFALLGSLDGRPLISLKCDPDRAEQLRQTFNDIIPGYYLNKMHWNSLYLDGALPDELILESIDQSHQLVAQGLPKKTQRALGILPA